MIPTALRYIQASVLMAVQSAFSVPSLKQVGFCFCCKTFEALVIRMCGNTACADKCQQCSPTSLESIGVRMTPGSARYRYAFRGISDDLSKGRKLDGVHALPERYITDEGFSQVLGGQCTYDSFFFHSVDLLYLSRHVLDVTMYLRGCADEFPRLTQCASAADYTDILQWIFKVRGKLPEGHTVQTLLHPDCKPVRDRPDDTCEGLCFFF